MDKVRDAVKHAALTIESVTPACADRTVAFRALGDALMNANRAIARQGRPIEKPYEAGFASKAPETTIT